MFDTHKNAPAAVPTIMIARTAYTGMTLPIRFFSILILSPPYYYNQMSITPIALAT
jgi:hypothetical protein